MTPSPWIHRGFVAAGAVNILGVLLFSKGLTNAYLSELDPQVFSTFGLKVIIVWGLAYLAVGRCYREAYPTGSGQAVRWVVAVFTLEKLLYFAAWVIWMSKHRSDLGAIFEASPLTGTFYVIYGPNDLLFAVFFGWVFWRAGRTEMGTRQGAIG